MPPVLTTGDLYLKGATHVHDSTGPSRFASDRRFADLALQLRLGVLPQRGPRLGARHRAGVGLNGAGIARFNVKGILPLLLAKQDSWRARHQGFDAVGAWRLERDSRSRSSKVWRI